jgi:hypothetical protein
MDYFTTEVVSATGATDVSAAATVESTATAVESVATASVEAFPPHATNVDAIAKIAITFFILFVLCLTNSLNLNKDGTNQIAGPFP